jgi:hypothetical protein
MNVLPEQLLYFYALKSVPPAPIFHYITSLDYECKMRQTFMYAAEILCDLFSASILRRRLGDVYALHVGTRNINF